MSITAQHGCIAVIVFFLSIVKSDLYEEFDL